MNRKLLYFVLFLSLLWASVSTANNHSFSFGLTPFLYNGTLFLGYSADYTLLSKNGDGIRLTYLTGKQLATAPDSYWRAAITYRIPLSKDQFSQNLGIGIALYEARKPLTGLSARSFGFPIEYEGKINLTDNLYIKNEWFIMSDLINWSSGYSLSMGVIF
jgi:hypothetical protein